MVIFYYTIHPSILQILGCKFNISNFSVSIFKEKTKKLDEEWKKIKIMDKRRIVSAYVKFPKKTAKINKESDNSLSRQSELNLFHLVTGFNPWG